MSTKIALEEHFSLTQFQGELAQYVNATMIKEIERQLLDTSAMRLEEMDAAGVGYVLLSLTAPGVQAEPDPQRAVVRARQVNDALAKIVAAQPARYGGF